MNQKLPLSVALISHNEEASIGRTLESISIIAKEIIVVDTFSSDSTKEIAERLGAKVFLEDWTGYASLKNSALSKCSQPWILLLDCDEVPTKELIDNITFAIQNPTADGYELDRKTVYLGKVLNYAWRPDWKLRLVHKDASPEWVGIEVHEELKISGKVGKLKGNLLHYSYIGIEHHLKKTIEYAKASAESYFRQGRKFSILNLIFNPFIAFIRLYIIHMGFLDGIRGLIAGFSTFVYTFLKYIFLWEKNK